MTNDKLTLPTTIADYTRSLTGRNISPHSITAYTTDLRQFISWIAETDISVTHPDQVTRYHISEYLSFLASKGLTGVTRARKLASIREFFKYLTENGALPSSPAASVTMPRKEKRAALSCGLTITTNSYPLQAATPVIFPFCNFFSKQVLE